MGPDVKMALAGIGGLIFAYLVFANASNFSNVTNAIANDSATVISTLQGRGSGSTSLSGVATLNA